MLLIFRSLLEALFQVPLVTNLDYLVKVPARTYVVPVAARTLTVAVPARIYEVDA